MTAPEAVEPWPMIDPSQNTIVLAVGRKGSGKSQAARTLFRHWPGVDRVVIDVNGDADPGPDATTSRGMLPRHLPPRGEHGEPVTLHYIADPRSVTYRDDLDRAVGLALFPQDRRTLLWVDEIGEVTQANRTPPNLRTLLMQSRHYHASALLCGPRPMNIDPLCLAQADRVLIFDLPNRADVDRVAEQIGWPKHDLANHINYCRRQGKYWFLHYVAGAHELYVCPPLPREWLAA